MNWYKKYVLEIVVFVCGASVMVFELVGSRVVAPYIGTSIYVWTSLIGIILASLSVGYYAGGYVADKRPGMRPMGLIVLLAAVMIALCAFVKDIVVPLVSAIPMAIEFKAVLASLILFAPASLFLGMISPYAVKLKMSDLAKSGATAGRLYALSTAGSIFGTFLAGFYVIPNFGSTNSLIIISIVLAIVSALLLVGSGIGRVAKTAVFFLIVFLAFAKVVSVQAQKNYVADVDTEYNRIIVREITDHSTGLGIRALTTDQNAVQAAMFTDGRDDLVFQYTKFYNLFTHFVPNPSAALMIGGSAYTYPRYFLSKHPNAVMDVVEIDPGMTEVARKHFDLKDDPRLVIHHEDGRIFLNKNTKKYDVIFGDAFSSAASTPFQLATEEAVTKTYDALIDGGVVMLNLISAIDGDGGRFARAEYATYKKVFPQVFLFAVQNAWDGSANQNLMLVALKSDKPVALASKDKQISEYLGNLWTKPIADDVPVLTDDFAPVEHYSRMAY